MVSSTLAALATVVAAGVVNALDISVSSEGNETAFHGYGFLHEDINNSGDGGIYAELIYNRAFQYSNYYPVSLAGYQSINGAILSLNLLDEPLSDALPYSMSVSASSNSTSKIGFLNEGYWGMHVAKQKYTGSFWVRGDYEGSFKASLQSALTDDVFGTTEIESKASTDEWVEHEFEIIPHTDAPNSNNTFAITFDPNGIGASTNGSATLDFNLISLFPPTYKDRKNGLRVDLAEALEGIHPTVLRFPGGNMLEGYTNKTYWDWKDTIKPLKERPGFQGVWGYQQTHGLGLMEYLYWAEDMGLEIVVAVWAGLALEGDVTPEDELDPFIQDALNEIEFIRGDTSTEWGAKRAELGHPEPFELKYVEVGNEDWLAGYPEGWDTYKEYRFQMFYEAITEAYPDITVIASADSGYDFVPPADVLGDYHPYRTPDALVEEFDRFDNDYPHIVGEVAATHPNGGIGWDGDLMPFPWWIGSVGEAVSLIGYERNGDRIHGSYYAPVLRNMNRWQWAITIVQFAADPSMTTRTTSWYVWELFADHPITHTLNATAEFGPVYYGAGKNEETGSLIWKGAVYNTTDSADVDISIDFEGVKPGTKATLTMLTNPSGDPFAYNDPHTGVNIVETTTTTIRANREGKFEFTMPELSVAVLDTDTSKAACKVKRGQHWCG